MWGAATSPVIVAGFADQLVRVLQPELDGQNVRVHNDQRFADIFTLVLMSGPIRMYESLRVCSGTPGVSAGLR